MNNATENYLPQTDEALNLIDFVEERMPGYTHKIDIERNRINGMTDDADALAQAIYLILNIERYQYPIYSQRYGSELRDLIGKPKDYAMSECKRRITEALIQDDRILDVRDWEFETGFKKVTAKFKVKTIYGELMAEKEFDF